jgi:hypothetical protein
MEPESWHIQHPTIAWLIVLLIIAVIVAALYFVPA